MKHCQLFICFRFHLWEIQSSHVNFIGEIVWQVSFSTMWKKNRSKLCVVEHDKYVTWLVNVVFRALSLSKRKFHTKFRDQSEYSINSFFLSFFLLKWCTQKYVKRNSNAKFYDQKAGINLRVIFVQNSATRVSLYYIHTALSFHNWGMQGFVVLGIFLM